MNKSSSQRDHPKSNAAQGQGNEAEFLDAERCRDVGEEVHGVVQAGADVEAVRAQAKVCFQAGDSGVPEVRAVCNGKEIVMSELSPLKTTCSFEGYGAYRGM